MSESVCERECVCMCERERVHSIVQERERERVVPTVFLSNNPDINIITIATARPAPATTTANIIIPGLSKQIAIHTIKPRKKRINPAANIIFAGSGSNVAKLAPLCCTQTAIIQIAIPKNYTKIYIFLPYITAIYIP